MPVDRRVRERAADHRDVQQAGEGLVVRPLGPPRDQAAVLLAAAVATDLLRCGRRVLGGRHQAPPPATVCLAPASAVGAAPGFIFVRRVLDRPNDVLVAGAAAEVALDAVAHLILGGVGVVPEEVDRLHDHAGRAVPALECVVVVEGLLHGVQLAVPLEALDGEHLGAVGLDGQHRAGLHAHPVEVNGARPAVARVAADHRARLAEPFTQVLDEQHAGLDVVLVDEAVDGGPDACHGPHSSLGRTTWHRSPDVETEDMVVVCE